MKIDVTTKDGGEYLFSYESPFIPVVGHTITDSRMYKKDVYRIDTVDYCVSEPDSESEPALKLWCITVEVSIL